MNIDITKLNTYAPGTVKQAVIDFTPKCYKGKTALLVTLSRDLTDDEITAMTTETVLKKHFLIATNKRYFIVY